MSLHKLQGNDNFDLEVVGEASYQSNLEVICGPKKPEGENKLVEALLILETNNPHDRNAVRVDIQGKTVGYLPRGEAKDLRKIFEA